MSEGPPISQQAPPAVDRGEPVGYALSPEFTGLASQMAAIMLQGLIPSSPGEFTSQGAARVAVELAMNIANEVRMYRLVDNKAVRLADAETQ